MSAATWNTTEPLPTEVLTALLESDLSTVEVNDWIRRAHEERWSV